MADVFISYKRSERQRVERIAELLRDYKMTVWFDAQLEAGRGEGFDAEIEREVTSAHCVVVCWTKDALKSMYVKAEAKKGLEREALVPVFLENCQLPVPFNGVDTIDLTDWNGDEDEPVWKRVVEIVQQRVESSRADESRRRVHSLAAYERVSERLYPGILALLVPRITAIGDWDTRDYGEMSTPFFPGSALSPRRNGHTTLTATSLQYDRTAVAPGCSGTGGGQSQKRPGREVASCPGGYRRHPGAVRGIVESPGAVGTRPSG
ncbi:MAG: toll/interleukin-1 receptor domain-containing protein [Propionivibrio sp.]|nr:toll/interleukin-1 receptor domain-containing protein [Propionivibrio sp.]